MPPRANIKEPEPDQAKRIVCNPSGEKEISVPLFTEDKETCRFYFRRRNHKEEHFERLFAEMYPRLVRFATTLMSNTEEAKDIVSETMEQAWKEFEPTKGKHP